MPLILLFHIIANADLGHPKSGWEFRCTSVYSELTAVSCDGMTPFLDWLQPRMGLNTDSNAGASIPFAPAYARDPLSFPQQSNQLLYSTSWVFVMAAFSAHHFHLASVGYLPWLLCFFRVCTFGARFVTRLEPTFLDFLLVFFWRGI